MLKKLTSIISQYVAVNVNNMNDCDVIIEISQRGQQTTSNHAVSDSLVTPLKNIET